MSNIRFPELHRPSILFVGVTTGRSFIRKLFPVWAEILELGEVRLEGVDLPPNDTAESYRRVIDFIRTEPLAMGALVTTHKINIYRHAGDLFDRFDLYGGLLGEVSSISKQNGQLIGHAKDPITSGLAFEAAAGQSYWRENPQAQALILGSGGSALAFAAYLLGQARENHPKRIVLTGRTPTRLERLEQRLRPLDRDGIVECRRITGAEDHDVLVGELPEFSLVVNATGMGKDRPGSPLTDAARFPVHGFVWEFNYRGELEFLHQAKAQADSRELIVEDGWRYFLHGWSEVIAEVFHFSLSSDIFQTLRTAADELRRRT